MQVVDDVQQEGWSCWQRFFISALISPEECAVHLFPGRVLIALLCARSRTIRVEHVERRLRSGRQGLASVEEPEYVAKKLELLRRRLEEDGHPAVSVQNPS